MLAPMLIDAARSAHEEWRGRLEDAIASGRLDVPLSTIELEDACRFGRWLLGPGIPRRVKRHPSYEAVREAHADFHRAAAEVARLAAAGRSDEARQALSPSGTFEASSAALLDALAAWRRSR